MSTIIRDSGKPYGAIADAAQNMWDSVAAGTTLLSGGRYATDDQCFSATTAASTTGGMQKASSSNDATCFAFFALFMNSTIGSTLNDFQFQLLDGANVQCTVAFHVADGSIKVYSGTTAGTLLATFASAFSQQQWNGWNIQVIVSNTAGEVHIRKNGSASDTFVITGANTRGGSTNNYANQYALVQAAQNPGAVSGWKWQDVWFYNSSGAVPNDFLANDVRTFWLAPNGASQTQFTAVGTATTGPTSITSTVALSINTEYAEGFTPKFNGTIASIGLNFNAGATGNVIAGLYDNTGAGGGPGNLLATSNTVTNPTSGVNTFTFSSPPTVSNLSTYYVAVLSSVAITLKSANTASSNYSLAQSFGSGFTNPGAMNTASFNTFAATLTYTANNYTNVSEQNEDGSTTTVQSSTPGNEDQYTTPGLPTVPSVIYGIQVRGFMQKSDSGARSGAMTISSSGTDVAGPSVALSTTFENVVAQQDTDPNTSTTWTPLGVNNALVGVKVAA